MACQRANFRQFGERKGMAPAGDLLQDVRPKEAYRFPAGAKIKSPNGVANIVPMAPQQRLALRSRWKIGPTMDLREWRRSFHLCAPPRSSFRSRVPMGSVQPLWQRSCHEAYAAGCRIGPTGRSGALRSRLRVYRNHPS